MATYSADDQLRWVDIPVLVLDEACVTLVNIYTSVGPGWTSDEACVTLVIMGRGTGQCVA